MLRRSLRFIRAGWTAIVLVLLASSAPSWASTYNLSYDELGRLVGVVDSGGNTAAYNYDALGNIVSIARGSGAVSIVSFSPQSGPVGGNVTISGYGFSATAGQNSVAFNGTAATVVSATTSQLIVTVPAGATSGPFTVTSPAGSATSTSAFSVVSGNAPTITSFSPTIGTPGTAVTVTGTNFQTAVSENKLIVNSRPTLVNAATATSIAFSVPALTSSGRIAITTPYGQAVSATDFIVPPSPYTPSSVGMTGRMAIGNSQTVTLSNAGTIGLVLFDGTAGQRVSVLTTSSTFGYCGSGVVRVLAPDGSQLGSNTNVCSGSFSGALVLPTTGTYTIVVAPYSSTTGNLTFTLYNVPPDPNTTTSAGGSAVTLSTTTPGQKMSLTFSGTAAQRVSLLISNSSSFGNYCGSDLVQVLAPDGTQVGGNDNLCSGSFSGLLVLPTTGTYTIAVTPYASTTGSATFTLYSVPPDPTATITIGGPAVTLGTTTPGQKMSLTFSGTAAQRVSLLISNSSSFGNYCGSDLVQVLAPDGTRVGGNDNLCSGSFSGLLVLPTTGTYTIAVTPYSTTTGSATFTLYSVPPDPTATITIGGPAVTLGTTTPGQKMSLTFSGTAGQKVSLSISNSSFGIYCGSDAVQMLAPDSSQAGSTNVCSNSAINSVSLSLTGTYTIAVTPYSSTTGSATFTLTGQ